MEIEKFNEFQKEIDPLFEMATISGKGFKYRITVHGGSKGGFRNEHGEPHFEVEKRDEFEISVKIPESKASWLLNKNLEITKGDFEDWEGHSDVRKDLIKWLDIPSELNENVSNLGQIVTFWNGMNQDNTNVKIYPGWFK